MQFKTSTRYYFTPFRMVVIKKKKKDDEKITHVGKEMEETGTLVHC